MLFFRLLFLFSMRMNMNYTVSFVKEEKKRKQQQQKPLTFSVENSKSCWFFSECVSKTYRQKRENEMCALTPDENGRNECYYVHSLLEESENFY